MTTTGLIAKRLARVLQGISDARARANEVVLDPPPGGLPMHIAWSERGISVALSRWEHAWSLTGDEEDADSIGEALDLVAAGVFGHVRVRVHTRGSVPVRWDVEFLIDERWSHHVTVRAGTWRGLWGHRGVETLSNRFPVPSGVVLARPGKLPFAPWVGMLGHRVGGLVDASVGEPIAAIDVDGVLDLHPFSPKEVAPLVRAYIDACLEQGITQLRIIHGKGIGHLRRTVHALLRKHPAVADFRLGGHGEGSWGATIVDLRPTDPPSRD